ncbi:MAG: MarC family NAAT transporter [Saprospiraceae bacterium]|nr:MarC family NAAT transporter [Saprospiraceae bacterium]
MLDLFVATLAALFSVVNPFGAVPVFLAMTPHYTVAERNKTAFQTSLYFVLILLSFFLAGTAILSFFGISINAMRIAGGMIILSSGFALLSGKFAESRAINQKVKEEALQKEDISFSPMAMPMLSGPGSISLLIGLFAEHPDWESRGMIGFVVIALGAIVYAILRSSPYLFKLLGVSGIKAMSRIMGFLVMAIGVQYVISGIVNLVKVLA